MTEKQKKLEPQICGVARKFHRRFGGDFAEIRQQAWLLFLECERTHDPRRGSLETRVEFVIYHRLLDQRRGQIRDQNRAAGYVPRPASFNPAALLAELSTDAADVLRAIFSAPAPAGRGGEQYGRRVAAAAGFSPDTISAAFAEIARVL